MISSFECPRCEDRGFLLKSPDAWPGDPAFGDTETCSCLEEKLFREKTTRLLGNSNLHHPGLESMTFSNWVHQQKGRSDAVWAALKNYAHNPQGWIVLRGSFGSGKTHLAVAAAHERLTLGEEAVFLVVPDLLDFLRATFSPNSDTTYNELFDLYKNVDFLVLDDFGTQATTQWAEEKLFQLANHRQIKQLPTIITTNLGDSQLNTRLGSRLRDTRFCKSFAMQARDTRATGSR